MSTYPTAADVPTWTPPTDPPIRADVAPEPVTYYPPLTEAEFNDSTGVTHNGIPFVESEDGDYVFAYGHRDKAQFAVAVNAYDLDMNGESTGYVASDVEHTQAVALSPADGPDGWYISWAPAFVEPSDQPSFPVTVVNR